jgi:hypothetical protein
MIHVRGPSLTSARAASAFIAQTVDNYRASTS